MPRALSRLVWFVFGAACAQAATPLAILRIGRVDYVRSTDVAAKLDLRLHWVSGRQLELADSAHRVELPADGRDASVDGLRVFLGEPALTRGGQLYLGRIDYERRLLPLLRPRLLGDPPARPRIIAIDPGHGGTDHGTENPRLHLMEKTFTLDVAFRLKKLLEAQGFQVVMTRTNDTRMSNDPKTDLPLRGVFANGRHADLFISIHFNSAAPDARTRGTEVFSFAPRTQRSSDSWQKHEDDSEPNPLHPEPSPANRSDDWNVIFAHAIHAELLRGLRTEDRGEKLAHFGVLRLLNCPGILVESAFLSNDAEAERVATPAFRQQIAEGMLAGIRDYAAELDALRPSVDVLKAAPAAQAAPKGAPGERPGGAAQPYPVPVHPAQGLQQPQRPN
jgi:N-acetylmuramoyl-L-alanine amidase